MCCTNLVPRASSLSTFNLERKDFSSRRPYCRKEMKGRGDEVSTVHKINTSNIHTKTCSKSEQRLTLFC